MEIEIKNKILKMLKEADEVGLYTKIISERVDREYATTRGYLKTLTENDRITRKWRLGKPYYTIKK